MMIIPQSDKHLPGTWKPLRLYHNGDQTRSATITCPECAQVGTLLDHEILADGTVSPSVACPTDGCTFHDHVKLERWDEPAS